MRSFIKDFLLILLLVGSCLGLRTALPRVRASRLFMAPPAPAATGKTPLVANGKRFEADPGSSMMAACLKLGLKVPTDCRKGECGACTVTVAGQKIRACIGKVPPAPRLKSLIEKGLAVTVDNK